MTAASISFSDSMYSLIARPKAGSLSYERCR